MPTPTTTERTAHEAEVRAAADYDTASELRANVRDLERTAADQRDQLTAAGCIIAALVRQLDSHGAIVPHLPNLPPGLQSTAMRMLRGVGLDCNGRRMRVCVVPSPAVQDAGGVGATPSAEAVEAFLVAPKVDDAGLSGRWGHRHSAPIPEGLAGLGARGQEAVAPGPTVDDLRADLVRRDVLMAQMGEERDAAQHQLREALAELAAMRAQCPLGSIVIPPARWIGDTAEVGRAEIEVACHPKHPRDLGWSIGCYSWSAESDGYAPVSVEEVRAEVWAALADAVGGRVVNG